MAYSRVLEAEGAAEPELDPFDQAECMTIERIRQNFIKSEDKNEQEKHRLVNLGKFTVNVELLTSYETIYKDDEK